MNHKLLSALVAIFVLLLLLVIFVRERWTTPADELKTVLGYYTFLLGREQANFEMHGAYVELRDLLGRGTGRYRVTSKCQDGYCFEVHAIKEATKASYTIRIFPNRNTPSDRRHLISLYADETQIVRVSYGSPPADSTSAALSPAEMRRFTSR